MSECGPTPIQVSNPFLMPLNSQRYFAAKLAMDAVRPEFLIDVGCSDANFLFYLSRSPNYLRFAIGIDKDVGALKKGERSLSQSNFPHRHGRPFEISLVCEDVTAFSSDFIDEYQFAPFVVILELIEHLEEMELSAAVENIFGRLKPLNIFLTTPNIEYNEILTTVFERQKRCRNFRHSDHKFEWNRFEFGKWVSGIREKYGYEAEIGGIGKVSESTEDIGSASHSVLFRRMEKVERRFVSPKNGKFLVVVEVDAVVNRISGFTPQPTPDPSENEPETESESTKE
jgi:hypothetical protein